MAKIILYRGPVAKRIGGEGAKHFVGTGFIAEEVRGSPDEQGKHPKCRGK
jgi:hypothetical protein